MSINIKTDKGLVKLATTNYNDLTNKPTTENYDGTLSVEDEFGNKIARIDDEGVHSIDFIAGSHKLSEKVDKAYVDESVKNVNVDLTGYATKEDVSNIDFYAVKNNPITDYENGAFTVTDENGYIGLQLKDDGLHVKDVIANGHKLSDKADIADIPSLQGYAKESWVSAEIVKSVTSGQVSLEGYATEEWVENKNYLTQHQNISHLATKDELYRMALEAIENNPLKDDNSTEFIIADDNDYIGLKLDSEGLYVKDVITSFGKLSDRATKADVQGAKDYALDLVNSTSIVVATDEDIDSLFSQNS